MIAATGKVLLPHDREELHRSGLNDDTIAAACIRSETPHETLAATLRGKKYPQRMAPAIVFPVPNEDGSQSGSVQGKQNCSRIHSRLDGLTFKASVIPLSGRDRHSGRPHRPHRMGRKLH
ncbi:MAG: hypothetical protein U0836_09290 [Pirellulales bacterium]